MDDEAPLDGRVDIPITLEREEFYELFLLAHARDITLNQLVESIFQEMIDAAKSEK